MLPQRLPETSKISAENEKTVALATVFSLFFVIEHIAVQRVFLYAGFGGNCLDRVLLGLALLHTAADCLSGRGKTFGLILLGFRLVRRTLEDEHELAARRVGVKVGNRLVERHAERLLMQFGQLARE